MKRWWFSVFIGVAALVEVSLRHDLPSRLAAVAFSFAIAFALLFRRTHPLAATGFAFTLATAVTLVRHHVGLAELSTLSSAGILVLPYALCRWASKRDVVIGLGFVALTWFTSLLSGELRTLEEIVGSAVVMTLPASIGAGLRFRDEAHGHALEQARSLEREQLARELHDSVAHHLTAITLQAQAARAVMKVSPDDAANALAAIESESKRTLVELRAIVGALRDEPSLAPAAGLAELRGLAQDTARPKVEVSLEGDLVGLAPVLERALFRLAQEAVTNAIKHARNASTVTVRVTGGPRVQLSARDDGEATSARGSGFGLVGMAERVALLGGTFEAGPLPGRGWRVDADFPRTGAAS